MGGDLIFVLCERQVLLFLIERPPVLAEEQPLDLVGFNAVISIVVRFHIPSRPTFAGVGRFVFILRCTQRGTVASRTR